MQVIVGGFIENNGKVLMVQEGKKSCYKKWNFPAGHLESGESIFDGAIREIFEETGCKVELTNMLPIVNKKFENDNFILLTFTAKLLDETISFDSKEILDVKWISIEDLENMNSENLRDELLIKNTLKAYKEKRLYPLNVIEMF